jgi:KipI family sensor histidine kinase inhibitor
VTGNAFPRLLWCGDTAFTIEFGETVDPALNRRVLALDRLVAARPRPGLVETVPTYRSLTVHCDPVEGDPQALGAELLSWAAEAGDDEAAGRLWRVPVAYGGEHGIDLAALAERHGLTPSQVIERHAAARYRVYMIGFMPGFTYLGGLDPVLATPRQPEPRAATPAGSVSIGGAQAAIASVEAPSAWHLIGRTPARMFAPRRDPPVMLAAGDEVELEPIGPERYAALDRAAAAGEPVLEELRR